MNETIVKIAEFLFVLAVPFVVVAGAVVTLFAAGALFDALEHPEALRQRIEGIFRQPPKPAKPPSSDHYYKQHWQSP